MSIQPQCCGLIMMLFLFIFIHHQKTVGLYAEKMFFYNLLINIACICLDIISLIALAYYEYLPHLLVVFICKLYLVLLCWMGLQTFVYTCLDTFSKERYQKRLKAAFGAIFISTTIIGFLPIELHTEPDNLHTSGPAVWMTYFCAACIILVTILVLTKEAEHIYPKRRFTILVWISIWIVAMLIQLISGFLVIGFACALCMLLLFIELENPENNLDRDTGLFNAHTLTRYLDQQYDNQESFSGLLLMLPSTQLSHSQNAQNDYAMLEIVNYLQTLPYAKIFKNVGREFFLAFSNCEELEHDFALIQQSFQTSWPASPSHTETVFFEPTYLVLPDSSVVDNADELLWLTKYFKIHTNDLSEKRIIYINQDIVSEKRRHDEMERIIIAALKEDRVEVFYQPIYSTHLQRFVSAEALVRIRLSDGSILPPGLFIPVAEETGLISQLGEVVFAKTCCFIAKENLQQYGIDYIEVNLSVTQCEHRNLASTYTQIMDYYSVDPGCINLEITESASLMAKNILLENMHVLIDYGVSFSLDDFGNGQSNLNYIVDMPVSLVKFDRDMTTAYFESAKAKSVMSAVNTMIHDMNLKVVSEGVETKAQLDEMIALGIDYIQGYYFSKPLPQDEFLRFIKERQPETSNA